jgi:dTMP kinase
MTPREFDDPLPEAVDEVIANRRAYRRLFSDRSFRNLWVGQTISGVGDWLIIGLLIPLVSVLAPQSSMAVAGIMIAKIIPSLLFGSVLGALVDRFDRKRLMVACDLINGVLCLGLIAASVQGIHPGVALAVIYAITFVMEVCNLLFVPAKNSLIPLLVEEQDLAAANGLSYTTEQASMLIGLLASGAIIAGFAAIIKSIIAAGIPLVSSSVALYPALAGPQGGIVLDFFSFMVSAYLISTIRVKRLEKHRAAFTLAMVGRDVIESFDILRSRRELRGLLLSAGFAILGAGAIISVGLVYVRQNLTGSIPGIEHVKLLYQAATQAPETFMLVFLGIGMFAGAVAAPKVAERFSLGTLFVASVTGMGVSLLGFAAVSIYWVAALFAIVAGVFIASATVAGNTYVADSVPNEMRGRIFAALASITRVALLASIVLTAPAGDAIGGIVRYLVTATGGDPATFALTGSRLTLLLASAIVIAAAFYSSRAIDWRVRPTNGEAPDA